MSDFGICEAIFAEAGGWGIQLTLGGDATVETTSELNVTPAPELQCNALSNQAQENDAQQSFVSEYKKPIIACVALGAVAIVSILAKMCSDKG
jgi:hypothetical protein